MKRYSPCSEQAYGESLALREDTSQGEWEKDKDLTRSERHQTGTKSCEAGAPSSLGLLWGGCQVAGVAASDPR